MRTSASKVISPKKTTGTKSMIKAPKGIKYYDLVKNWAKVKRHLDDPELNDILVADFNKYTYGRWEKKFTHGQFPTEFENCDWQLGRRGRPPAYWRYTKHEACHWLVNFNLRLAQLVEPARPWRIVTSRRHSTVWDGGKLLFEFNFQAFGVPPADCFEDARGGGRELKVGERRLTFLAGHWTVEARRHEREQRRRFRSAGLAHRGPTKATGVFKRSRTQTKQKQSTR
jgi:hypothetical protein